MVIRSKASGAKETGIILVLSSTSYVGLDNFSDFSGLHQCIMGDNSTFPIGVLGE